VKHLKDKLIILFIATCIMFTDNYWGKQLSVLSGLGGKLLMPLTQSSSGTLVESAILSLSNQKRKKP